MNPLLNEYQRHYIEAQKSAHEAINQLISFGENFSCLTDNDKMQLFNQIIDEHGRNELLRSVVHYFCFGTLG